MADYLIDGEILGDIASAIREKTSSTNSITPENMASEIANMPTGGGSENAVLSVFVSTGYMTYVLDIINAIQAEGGDTSKLTFVTLQGYLNRNIAVSFANYDGNIYHIECIDLSNMAKIYNPDTDNTIDVASTRIADFLDAGSPKTEMPQIRFAGAIYRTGKVVSADNPLTLSVEIVGGGSLQAGDKLQICAKRTYKYSDRQIKKQKLRQQLTKEITYEDIGKRFLTITTNDTVDGWLFKNDRNSTINSELDTQSAFYLRIKRVTKYNGDGDECDAIFSNIVTVWKTYNPNTYEVNIK